MKKIFYIYSSGFLRRQDESLVLQDEQGNKYLPIEQIDTIICYCDVTLNKRTLSLLRKYEIAILFYDFYGNYIGCFNPSRCNNGKCLIEQVNAYNDENKKLIIAKEFNRSAFHNMLSLIKYYNKKGDNLLEKIQEINNCILDIENCSSIEELLLLEAKCKQIYYSCFNVILMKTEYEFISRSKRPPANEVNAMMSYGYSLLYGIVNSAIHSSKLSAQISFIHSSSKHNDSLKYDIADIFKPVLIDRMIFRLIRRGQIKKEHFDHKEEKVYLNLKGCKIFCEEFNKNLESIVKCGKRSYSYKSIINREISNLTKYILENKKYKGYKMQW